MLRLRVDVAKQIDGSSHGPNSFGDAVQRALRNESWDKDEPRMALDKVKRAVVLIERSTSGGTKRSFGALVGSSRNSKQRNFPNVT